MSIITSIHAREILDSRGNPTLEAEVVLDTGAAGRAAVPSGASTGEFEAVELRDGDDDRYGGKGVLKRRQRQRRDRRGSGRHGCDDQVRSTRHDRAGRHANKSSLGANAILAVSLAVARAAAMDAGLPLYRYLGGPNATLLPVPLMNILNGGAHAANNVDLQEFMIAPVGMDIVPRGAARGRRDLPQPEEGALEAGEGTTVGDEGGFAPDLGFQRGGHRGHPARRSRRLVTEPGEDVLLALDAAASEMHRDGAYVFHKSTNERRKSSEEMVEFWRGLGGALPHRLHRGRPRRERLGRLDAR
jgi:enolase